MRNGGCLLLGLVVVVVVLALVLGVGHRDGDGGERADGEEESQAAQRSCEHTRDLATTL